MTRITARIDLAVPADLCAQSVQTSMSDPRLLDAYRALRAGREYSGWVTVAVPGRRLEIAFAALDPSTNRRMHRFGWRVTYDFLPLDDGRTRVEVGIEYSRLAAIAAAGTLRVQAENDLTHRLIALHALELGLRHAAAPLAAGAAADGWAAPRSASEAAKAGPDRA